MTNAPELQRYAAEQTLNKLQAGSAHEAMVKVAGYILGEFGHLLQVPCAEYFALLQQRFPACSLPTKALLLSAYAKLVTHTTDVSFAEQVKAVFQRYHAYADVELQQRSVEYFAMAQYHVDKLKEVLAPMPVFPDRTSALERRAAGDAVDSSQAPLPMASMQAVTSSSLPTPSSPVLIDFGAEDTAPGARGGAAQAPLTGAAALDLLLDDAAPARPVTHAPAASANALDDLLGLGGAPASQQMGAPMAQRAAIAPVQPLQDPVASLHALTLKDSGVLYEDPFLQIGVKCDFRQNNGRVVLFLGNKHNFPLRLRADLHAVEGLRVDMGAMPQSIAEGQQATVQLSAVCVAPFPVPPGLTVAYTLQNTLQEVVFNVTLPLFATKFLAPAPSMEKSVFYQGWARLTGPQKLEVAVQSPAFLTAEAWHAVFAGLRLNVLPDVDPNPANVFAASVLCTDAGQPLCVVRFEGGVKHLLTVASPSPGVAAAVKACIVPLIGG